MSIAFFQNMGLSELIIMLAIVGIVAAWFFLPSLPTIARKLGQWYGEGVKDSERKG